MSGNKESDTPSETEAIEEVEIENTTSSENAEQQPIETAEIEEADQSPEELIDALQADLSKAQEDLLRAKAEEQNAMRRAALEVEKARKFALEAFVKELLPVVDNLERAIASLDSDDPNSEAVLEGVELTLKTLQAALEKNRVKAIDPEGESFNPELHQAMAMVENPDVEPNSVIEVFQKGYELNGRLIRPAMVVVSKAG